MVFEKYDALPDDEWDDEDRANIAELRAQYPHLVPQPDAEVDAFGPDSLDDEPAEVLPDPKDES